MQKWSPSPCRDAQNSPKASFHGLASRLRRAACESSAHLRGVQVEARAHSKVPGLVLAFRADAARRGVWAHQRHAQLCRRALWQKRVLLRDVCKVRKESHKALHV